MAAEAPVGNGLIVDIGLRLGQKGLEILTDTQLFRTGAGVIRTAAAPQIELVAGIVQAAGMGMRVWPTLRTSVSSTSTNMALGRDGFMMRLPEKRRLKLLLIL